MRKYPTVSIIFPNYNGGTQPTECIRSITNLSYPLSKIEVIMIDNHSSDNSVKLVKKRFPWVKIIVNAQNLGFAHAVNIGIKAALGKFVFIGNDDIIFEKNSLQNLFNYLLSHQKVGVISGKIFVKSDPKKITSAGFMMNKWTGNIHTSVSPNKIKEPDWVPGCAMLVPKTVTRTVGLFDTNFSLIYFEDFDYCVRVKQAGYKVVYIPQAVFWHGVTKTMNRNASVKYFEWYKNKIRFIFKHLPLINILSILLIQTLFVIPLRTLIFRDGRFIPYIRGFIANLKNLPALRSARSLHTYVR